MSNDFFFQAFVYLAAAVLTVPISKRLGLGSVLGYLIAGVVIGPFGLRLVGQEGEDVMRFAEFGVVMMLFLVGLQLQPELLWRMRLPILGLGGLQMIANLILLSGLGMAFGLAWQPALAIALILPLSSTAIGVQTLTERGLMRTEGGQSAFSVLLFQAVAVIPILALLPLLATSRGADPTISSNALTGWQQTLLVITTVGGIVVGGRFLMRPVFRFIAATRLREMFTATALLLVVGITLAMQTVGLSPALGTFLAGVVLAESEYRHELNSTVEPFQSLLLGLFFLSVGASINFNLILTQPLLILGLIVGVSIFKSGLLIGLGQLFKLDLSQSILFAFALVQGDEFAFVLFSFAAQTQVISQNLAGSLIAVVALSMLLSPLFMIAYDRISAQFISQSDDLEADEIDDNENAVIIAGFGRFGQIVGRLLLANGYAITVLEHNPAQIELLRRFGWKVFYGDASRIDLLYASGAAQAKLLVVAIDDAEQILEIVDLARKHFPDLKILARAIDRRHAYELIRRRVDVIQRETFGSALDMGVEALKLLGVRSYRAHRAALTFRHHDQEALQEMALVAGDDSALLARSRQLSQDLERILQSDEQEIGHEVDRAWDVLAQQRETQ